MALNDMGTEVAVGDKQKELGAFHGISHLGVWVLKYRDNNLKSPLENLFLVG